MSLQERLDALKLTKDQKLGLVALITLWLLSEDSAAAPVAINETPFQGQLLTKSLAFDNAVQDISKRTGIPFNYLMFHMNQESGLRPNIENPKSGAYGLFQLLPKYSKAYLAGASFDTFKSMSDLQQLVVFERFLNDKLIKGKVHSAADMRLAGFAPAKLGLPDSAVVYQDDLTKQDDAFDQHAYLDKNGDKIISVGEVKAVWTKQYNDLIAKEQKAGKPIQVKL